MTIQMKPKKYYFDGLVMENILSYLHKPVKKRFEVGSYTMCENGIDITVTKITQNYILVGNLYYGETPFTLKKKKKVDDKGEYIEFVNSRDSPNESRKSVITGYLLKSDNFRPNLLCSKTI